VYVRQLCCNTIYFLCIHLVSCFQVVICFGYLHSNFGFTANENGYQEKEENEDGPVGENNEQPTVESLQSEDAQPSAEEVPPTGTDGDEGPSVENPEIGVTQQPSVEDSVPENDQEPPKEESQQPSIEVSQQENVSQTMTRKIDVPNNKVG
jgi:hypothetical protein